MIEIQNQLSVNPENGNSTKPLLPAVPLSEVYNEDCVTALKRYADNHFDLAIVDPPYELNGWHAKGKPTFNRKRMWPFTIHYRPATHIHFVELIDNRIAWTLIFRFKRRRIWGFWQNGSFTKFWDYFKINGC